MILLIFNNKSFHSYNIQTILIVSYTEYFLSYVLSWLYLNHVKVILYKWIKASFFFVWQSTISVLTDKLGVILLGLFSSVSCSEKIKMT